MAFNFPNSPTVGQISNGFSWNGSAWVGNGQITPAAPPSDAPPSNPVSGQLWWQSSTGRLYLWYVDADTSQWVQISGPGVSEPPNDGKSYVRRGGMWRLAPAELVDTRSISTSTEFVVFELPAEFTSFTLRIRDALASGAGYFAVQYRFGASTWYASIGNYSWCQQYASNSSHDKWSAGASGISNAILLNAGAINVGSSFSSTVDINPGTASTYAGLLFTSQHMDVNSTGSGYLGVNGRITALRLLSTVGNFLRLNVEVYGNRGA